MRLDEVKPRILQPLNGPVIIENIKKKIVAYARKHGINLGEIDSWTDGDIQYINVENNTGSHHFVEEIDLIDMACAKAKIKALSWSF